MPTYSYVSKSLSGETRKGKREARSKNDLAQILKQEGCFLISAKPVVKKTKLSGFLPRLKYVPLSQKLLVTRNLQVMVAAGISLPRALEVLANQTKSRYFKKSLEQMREMVLKGTPLSKAVSQYPKIFPEIYVSMLKVGEKTGELQNVLAILGQHLERNYRLRSRIKGAMLYPAIIVSAMVLIGAVMMIKVVPELSKTFEELGIQLPLMTRVVIASGDFLAQFWYFLLLFLVVFVLGFYFALKSKQGKRALHKVNLSLPILSRLVKKINSAYTALSLSALVRGGVPIVLALKIASDSTSNVFYKKALVEVSKKVEKGEKLSQTVARYPKLYSPLFVQMLQVGEETGQTSEILEKLAGFLEEEVNNSTKNLSTVIEPLLLLFIGAVVALFAISLVQPIYSILQGM